MRQLAIRAGQWTRSAFRPATQASYRRKFRLFLAFCCFTKIELSSLTPVVVLSFLEFLYENKVSPSAIANHISAIKASLALHGLSTHSFQDQRVAYFQRSLALNQKFASTIKKVIDIELLHKIVQICDSMWMGQVYKAVYLTAFFSFLRVSNLVPHAEKSFSPAEQLAKGDVITSSDAVFLIIKWSKTMQTRDSVKIIKLPNLLQSPICPVRAINNMLILAPGQENHPLFQVKNENGKWVPLTDTRLRRNFAQILSRLGLQTSGISLHTFRRSGATLAFNSNVAIQNIQSHGTWTSDSVWRYIVQDQTASQQVADTFQRLLATPPTTS